MRTLLKRALWMVLLVAPLAAGDWPDWRGPRRDGTSPEKGLPNQWSPAGQNLAWKAPYGARSAPIVVGDRLYLQNPVGKGPSLQERVMCFHADTGKLLWEHRFNVFHSDVPWHRVGWASPVGDPATGNVYAFGVGGTLLGLSREGKVLWERSLAEEFGLVTTHGGRTVSPVIDGDLLIISGITTGWGDQSRAAHRFIAFDKRSGETLWVSTPGGRPFDTTYSPPVISVVNGMRLLIAGGGDGTVHAIQAQTGVPVWKYVISKRGLNTGAVISGSTAIVSHSEENLDTSEMGMVAAIDAGARGDIGPGQVKWAMKGFQGGFSSPLIDGDRVLQIDNGGNLFAFDVVKGRQLWKQNLGTIQKASPVLADGKIYVGTENGKFYILRAGQERCEILDQDPLGSATTPEVIIASPAVSRGRVYVVSMEALYAIGQKTAGTPDPPAPREPAPAPGAAVAHIQVIPTELLLKPGGAARFRARLYDAQGRFLREEQPAWSLEQLKGAIGPGGQFAASADAVAQAGLVKATVGSVAGAARVRVVPPLDWSENFEAAAGEAPPRHWINATGKYALRNLDGNKVLVKLADNPFTKRARVFMGPVDWHDYTVEADFRADEKRRQMGDAGVVAERYQLVLFGNHQRLELGPWQPETERTVTAPFAWKAHTWYRLKLRVENLPDGKTRARGKAWAASEPEPAAWMIEMIDSIPNRQGSPGIYADAPFEVFFDNLKVTANP